MTERGEGAGEPFDPSTREFPAVEGEAERLEQRHEVVSMDTSTFMAIPAPTPTTPFVPPEFDERQGRLGQSTAFFSIATAFSRVAGLVREIVAASYFGITGPMSPSPSPSRSRTRPRRSPTPQSGGLSRSSRRSWRRATSARRSGWPPR
jgi:hypothetical protein